MMANVDVFVGNDTLIDPDIYQLWLNGNTAHEAASIEQKRGNLQQYGATFNMLLADVDDHFRTLRILERYLKSPDKLSTQLEIQISPDQQNVLIEKYYEFDPAIVREILGKKLTSRHRNSLDDVSEKTRIPLRSCRRQFDNIKRVFKAVEEMNGSLVENIKANFLLSHELAQQYAAIVFITNNRFDLSKKKLGYLTFTDFVHCTNMMIAHWSYSSQECKDHEDNDVDLDKDFLQDLREVKTLTERENLDEHKQLIYKSSIKAKMSPNAFSDIDANFKSFSKILINLACGLNHSKDLRDFFLDILEKIIEPCRASGWLMQDVQVFFHIYQETSQHITALRSNQNLANVWGRYLRVTGSCIVQMYHL